MKRRIRLTEGDLRRIVNRSVRRMLKESSDEIPSSDLFAAAMEVEPWIILEEIEGYLSDEDFRQLLINILEKFGKHWW